MDARGAAAPRVSVESGDALSAPGANGAARLAACHRTEESPRRPCLSHHSGGGAGPATPPHFAGGIEERSHAIASGVAATWHTHPSREATVVRTETAPDDVALSTGRRKSAATR